MWEFHSSYDGFKHCWSWKYFFHGIQRRVSGDFRTMDDAVHDARQNGFEMHVHRWQIMPSLR